MNQFEDVIRGLTREINGQYPRPWMTELQDPASAQVFIVGYNPAKAYPTTGLEHERHLDALFNRNGQTCRGLYSEITKESPTRGNIEMLADKLAAAGITSILQTNVVCYATDNASDLSDPEHEGGEERGSQIFRTLVSQIRPKAIIVHGVGASKQFNRTFTGEPKLPPPSISASVFPHIDLSTGTRVFAIPSLALPGFNNWPPKNSFCNWADRYLNELAVQIARIGAK